MSTLPLPQKLAIALKKRRPLYQANESARTDCVRLVDGSGDALPGIYLEDFNGAWLVSTKADSLSPALRAAFCEAAPGPLAWKHLSQHQKDSPVALNDHSLPEFFTGHESGLKTQLSFRSGYSQGIFLDQRDNRNRLRALSAPGKKVLNTFAYTGMFSVAAAAAGATTTTLDLSQVYLDWAKENFRLNGLPPDDHYFCKGDTFHWLKRFAKQGRTFDAIVLDPPTFSRDDKGKVFRAASDYPRLFELALACLAPGGTILACTNARTVSSTQFQKDLIKTLPRPTQATAQTHLAPMPPDFTETPYLKSLWVTLA